MTQSPATKAEPFKGPFTVGVKTVKDINEDLVAKCTHQSYAQWLCDKLNAPTAQPMAGEDVREAFEAAVIEREGDGTVIRGLLADLDHDGGYHNGEIHDEWLIWQAAWQAALAWQARAAQAPAATDDAADAARWRALVGCGHLRMMGWAGFDRNGVPSKQHLHFGMEAWSHPHVDLDEAHEKLCKAQREQALKILTNFVDRLTPPTTDQGNGNG